jgi:hypothetical protein
VGERTVEDLIEEQLADPRAEYLHVRNAEAGCFIARVEPVFRLRLTAAHRNGQRPTLRPVSRWWHPFSERLLR